MAVRSVFVSKTEYPFFEEFVGLTKAGLTNELKSIESYLTLFRTNPDGSPVGPEAYENVPLLHKGKLQFLTEMIPCTFSRECVEQYYRDYEEKSVNKILL